MAEVFDVIVVGGGGSGLAAAIEAHTAGARVVLLEKNAQLGGSTARSVGSISCSQTPHQLRKGIIDSPEAHFEDMPLFAAKLGREDNDALRRVLCAELPDTFRWLISLGVRFYGPMPEPPHRKPRMHNVLPNSRSFIHHLSRRARRLGIDIRCGCDVSQLLLEGGRVIGVECSSGGERHTIHARGVVLAAGDFTNSPELKRIYMGARVSSVDAVNPGATGDGQKLGLALGARILNGDLAQGPDIRFLPPAVPHWLTRVPPWPLLGTVMAWSLDHLPQWLLRPFIMSFVTTALAPSPGLFAQGAILVNKGGERFTDERDAPAFSLPEQTEKIAYILLDDRLAKRFSAWPHFISTAPGVAYAYVPDYRRNRPDLFTTAANWEALGQKIGTPPGALAATMERHNKAVATEFGLVQPPFVALGPVRSVFVHSEGGLAVDTEHRVLDATGQPLPGLYAAGSTGQGGLLLQGHGHHLAWAFVSGRRSGRMVAVHVSDNSYNAQRD